MYKVSEFSDKGIDPTFTLFTLCRFGFFSNDYHQFLTFTKTMTRFAAHRTAAKIYDETSVNASGEGPNGKNSVELEIL